MINPDNKTLVPEKSVSTHDTLTKNSDHKTGDPKNSTHKTADPKNPDTKSMSSQQGFKGLSNNEGKCDTNKDIKK